MDSDAEGFGLGGQIDGAIAVGHGGHQGGGGEDAFAVAAEDAVGDAWGKSEVVGVDD